jgi:hypothetical protein
MHQKCLQRYYHYRISTEFIFKNDKRTTKSNGLKNWYFLAIVIFIFSSNGFSQTPSSVFQLGGTGVENLSHLECIEGNNKIIAGVYDVPFTLGDEIIGENDVFISSINETGQTNWSQYFGSNFDDDISGLAISPGGYIYGTGSFWLEAQLGDFLLTSSESPKSIFLTQLSASTGDALWAQTIEGSDVKVSSDLAINANEEIIISGFFSETLFIGDTTLYAQADTDLFLAVFDQNGNLKWALNRGQSGINKALSIALLSNDDIAVTGTFNDTLLIADTVFVAETSDDDVFIARYSQEGEVLWATKAGGVHEELVIELQTDDQDNIYASGHFVGVINLDNGLSIQSATGWADLFLLKYASSGEILNARRFGGSELQHNSAMEITANHIFLAGTFLGTMTIGNNNYDAGSQTSAFITRLGHDLIPETGWTLRSSSNSVFPTTISISLEDNVCLGGSYGSDIIGVDALNTPFGPFDMFILEYPEGSINRVPKITSLPGTKVFPNPATEKIQLEVMLKNYTVYLYNVNGLCIWEGHNSHSIDVDTFPSGMYFIKIINDKFELTHRIIIQKE